MTGKTMTFRTIADLQQVPEDSIDDFCEDLRIWMTAMRHVENEFREEFLNAFVVIGKIDEFVWVNDGRHDAHVTVTVRDAEPKGSV